MAMTDDTSDVWMIKLRVPEDLPATDHDQLKSHLMFTATKHRSLFYSIMPTGHTFRFRGRESAAAFHACIAEALPSGSTVTVSIEDPLPDYVLQSVIDTVAPHREQLEPMLREADPGPPDS